MLISVLVQNSIHENVKAQDMIELKLLTKMNLTRSEIEARFKMVSFIKDYPTEIQFQIAVPHDWGVVPVKPSIPDLENPITIMGRLKVNSSDKADIAVWSVFLPHEIHPADWLESWVNSQDYTVLDSRIAHTAFGLVSDLIATRTISSHPCLCRLTAIKDADRIILLVARVTTQHPDEFTPFQESFLMAVQTLKLLNPTKQKFAEAFDWVTFDLPSQIRFLMPHSWQPARMSDVPDGGTGTVFKNILQDVVLGSIFVVSASQTFGKSIDIENILVSKVKNNDFVIKPNSYKIISETMQRYDLKVIISQQRLSKDNKNYVLTSARYEYYDESLVLMLLSPDKVTHFEAWAINRRAFEILVNSVEFSSKRRMRPTHRN